MPNAQNSEPTTRTWSVQDYTEHLRYYASIINRGPYCYKDVLNFVACARQLRGRNADAELVSLNQEPAIKGALGVIQALYAPAKKGTKAQTATLENVALFSDQMSFGTIYKAKVGQGLLLVGTSEEGTALILSSHPVVPTYGPRAKEIAGRLAQSGITQGLVTYAGQSLEYTPAKQQVARYAGSTKTQATVAVEYKDIKKAENFERIPGYTASSLPESSAQPDYVEAVLDKLSQVTSPKTPAETTTPVEKANAKEVVPSEDQALKPAQSAFPELNAESFETALSQIRDAVPASGRLYTGLQLISGKDVLEDSNRASGLDGDNSEETFQQKIAALNRLYSIVVPSYAPRDEDQELKSRISTYAEDSKQNGWGSVETLARLVVAQDREALDRGIKLTNRNSQARKLQRELLTPVLERIPEEYKDDFASWGKHIPVIPLAKEVDRLAALPEGANAQKEIFATLMQLERKTKAPSPFDRMVTEQISKIADPRIREMATNLFAEAKDLPGFSPLLLADPVISNPELLKNPLQLAKTLTTGLNTHLENLNPEQKAQWHANLEQVGLPIPEDTTHYFTQRLLDNAAYSFIGGKQREIFYSLQSKAQEQGMTPDVLLDIIEKSYTREAQDDSQILTQNLLRGMNAWAKENNKDVDFSEVAVRSGLAKLPAFLRTPIEGLMTFAHENLGVGWDTVAGTASWITGAGADIKEGFTSLFQADMRYSPYARLDEQIHDRFVYMDRLRATGDLRERQTQAGIANLQKIASKFGARLDEVTARTIVETVTSPTFAAVQNQLVPQLKGQFPHLTGLIDQVVKVKDQIFTGLNGDYMALFGEAAQDARFASELNTAGQFAQFAAAGPSADNGWANAERLTQTLQVMRQKHGFRLANQARRRSGDVARYLQTADPKFTEHIKKRITADILSSDLLTGKLTDNVKYNTDGTVSVDNYTKYFNAAGEEISYEDWKKLPVGQGSTNADQAAAEVQNRSHEISNITDRLLQMIQDASPEERDALLSVWKEPLAADATVQDRVAHQLATSLPDAISGDDLYRKVADIAKQHKQVQTSAMGLADYNKVFKPGEEAQASAQLTLMLGNTDINAGQAASDQASRNILWAHTNQMSIQDTVSLSQAVGQTLQKYGIDSTQIGAATEFAQLLHYSTMNEPGGALMDPAQSRAYSAQIAGKVYASRDMSNAVWLLSTPDQELSKELRGVKERLRSGKATREDYKLLHDRNALYEGWEVEDKSGFDLRFSPEAQKAWRAALSPEDLMLTATASLNMSFQQEVVDRIKSPGIRDQMSDLLGTSSGTWKGLSVEPDDVRDAITALITGKVHTDRIKKLLSGEGPELSDAEKQQLKTAGISDEQIEKINTIRSSAAGSPDQQSALEASVGGTTELALKRAGVSLDAYNNLSAPDTHTASMQMRTSSLFRRAQLPENTNLQEALNNPGGLATFAASIFKGLGSSVNQEKADAILDEQGLALLFDTASYARTNDDFTQFLFQNKTPTVKAVQDLAKALELNDDKGDPLKVTEDNLDQMLRAVQSKLQSASVEQLYDYARAFGDTDTGRGALSVLKQHTRKDFLSEAGAYASATQRFLVEDALSEETKQASDSADNTTAPGETASAEVIPDSISLESAEPPAPAESAAAVPTSPAAEAVPDQAAGTSTAPAVQNAGEDSISAVTDREQNAIRVVVVNASQGPALQA